MTDTFDEAKARINKAKTPAALFDGDDPDVTYKALAKLVHPDTVEDKLKNRATKAFAKLQVLWDEFNGKVAAPTRPQITTRKHTYLLGDLAYEGSIANLYDVEYADPDVRQALLKMPRSVKDSDLMEREAKALKRINEQVDADYRMYYPNMVETFRHKDAATSEIRRCNVFEPIDGFYTLAEIGVMYPKGLDPRDAAWIWRRLFVAIGIASDCGIIHGAVTPENVLIHPVQHGVILIDWCYSCIEDGQKIPAIVPGRRSFYPKSVLDKEAPTYATDIYTMANTMLWLLGSQANRPFRGFANGCMVNSPPKANELLGEFDELLFDQFGPRKYRPLEIPS